MLKCLEQVKRLVESIGGELAWSPASSAVDVIAPRGYAWHTSCSASICVPADNGSQTWWAVACREITDEIMLGAYRCSEDQIADITQSCLDDGDGEWRAPEGAPEKLVPTSPPGRGEDCVGFGLRGGRA